MKCPACSSGLSKLNAGDVEVEFCSDGCGGVWFDRNEITKFDESKQMVPDVLLSARMKPGVALNSFPRKCPRCEKEYLLRKAYDSSNPAEIDLCCHCGGIWLDAGELEKIRQGGGEKTAAGNAFLRTSLDLCSLAKEKRGEFAALEGTEVFLSKLKSGFFER